MHAAYSAVKVARPDAHADQMKRYGSPDVIVTDRLRSDGAAMNEIGNPERRRPVVWGDKSALV